MSRYEDQLKYEIELDYSGLGEGETSSGLLCPACKGGASEEKSLNVSRRDGVLLWFCHRASCGFSGRSGAAAAGSGEGRGSKEKRKPYYIRTTPLGEEVTRLLAERYRITSKDLELAGFEWTGEGVGVYARRVHMPIFGPDSRKRGANLRSYEGKQPRALIQMYSDEEVPQCWYKWKRKSKVLLLVEDQVSAVRAAKDFHVVALLGTTLSNAKVQEIVLNHEYEHVLICLDQDATYTAIRTQLRLRNTIKGLLMKGLGKDIKDFDDEEYAKFVQEVNEL